MSLHQFPSVSIVSAVDDDPPADIVDAEICVRDSPALKAVVRFICFDLDGKGFFKEPTDVFMSLGLG